jgi:hypothetical protein
MSPSGCIGSNPRICLCGQRKGSRLSCPCINRCNLSRFQHEAKEAIEGFCCCQIRVNADFFMTLMAQFQLYFDAVSCLAPSSMVSIRPLMAARYL